MQFAESGHPLYQSRRKGRSSHAQIHHKAITPFYFNSPAEYPRGRCLIIFPGYYPSRFYFETVSTLSIALTEPSRSSFTEA